VVWTWARLRRSRRWRINGRWSRLEICHDWLPVLLFTTVFEEVSFLALTLRAGWQNEHLIAFESLLFRCRRWSGCIFTPKTGWWNSWSLVIYTF